MNFLFFFIIMQFSSKATFHEWSGFYFDVTFMFYILNFLYRNSLLHYYTKQGELCEIK